jgi:hypothetical protein
MTRLQHSDRFGDNIPLKPKNTLRIGFQNIGGFPTQTSHIKEDYIQIGLSNWNFDIVGLIEANTDWRLKTEDTNFGQELANGLNTYIYLILTTPPFLPSTKNNMEVLSFFPSTTQPIESLQKDMTILI